MEFYRTTELGMKEAHRHGWVEAPGTKEFLIEQAHHQMLIIFEDEAISIEDVKSFFALPIPPPENDLKIETRKLFNYILENFDELLKQLLDKNYIAKL